jgi:hypothetical protein
MDWSHWQGAPAIEQSIPERLCPSLDSTANPFRNSLCRESQTFGVPSNKCQIDTQHQSADRFVYPPTTFRLLPREVSARTTV